MGTNCGVTMKRRRSSVGPHQGGAKRVRTFVDPVDGVRSPFRPVNGLSGQEEQNSKKRVRGSPAGNPRGVKRHCGGANRVAPAAPNLDPAEIALRKAQAASEATANYAKIQNWFSQNQAPQVQRVSTPQRQAEWQSMRSQVQKSKQRKSKPRLQQLWRMMHGNGAEAPSDFSGSKLCRFRTLTSKRLRGKPSWKPGNLRSSSGSKRGNRSIGPLLPKRRSSKHKRRICDHRFRPRLPSGSRQPRASFGSC